MLFEVAIVTKKLVIDGKTYPERIIYGPKPLAVEDESTAKNIAIAECTLQLSKEIPERATLDPSTAVPNWMVYVRPFR